MRQSIQNTSYYVAKDILNLNVTYEQYAPAWLPDYVPLPPNIQKINHALGQVGFQIPGDLARSPEIIVFDEKPCEVCGLPETPMWQTVLGVSTSTCQFDMQCALAGNITRDLLVAVGMEYDGEGDVRYPPVDVLNTFMTISCLAPDYCGGLYDVKYSLQVTKGEEKMI